MKSNFKIISFAAFCFIASSAIWEGCQQQTPSAAALSAPVTDQFALFNITSSTVAPGAHLYGNPSPTGKIQTASYSTPITVCGGATPFELVPAGSEFYNPESSTNLSPAPVSYTGSISCSPLATVAWNVFEISTGLTDGYDAYGMNIVGSINDPENSSYGPGAGNLDEVVIEDFPAGLSALYDLTPYHGIQFYLYVSPTDSTVDRVFSALVEQQNPPGSPPGTCDGISTNQSPDPSLTHCFNGFQYDFTSVQRGQWVLIQKNWTDLIQVYGSITNPPTFSGTNLQQFDYFAWVESNANSSGPETVNFTIAGVRLY